MISRRSMLKAVAVAPVASLLGASHAAPACSLVSSGPKTIIVPPCQEGTTFLITNIGEIYGLALTRDGAISLHHGESIKVVI
jgi:hypothetical protein